MALKLLSSVTEILEKTKEVTGKDIVFIERNDLPAYAAVKPARAHMPAHIFFHKKDPGDVINHLLAHECGHLLRIFGVPPEKRLIPRTNNQIKLKALSEIEPEIRQLSSHIPFQQLAQVVDIWYAGTVRQVTNFPPDIMVEKWIYDEYPELRPYQSRTVNKQYKESVQGLSRQVAEMTPRKFLNVCNTMNYTFFLMLGTHLGVDYLGSFRNSRYSDKGEELATITKDYLNNYEGDVQTINKWAQFLELSHWFTWSDFEDVPKNYDQML
jgi:hypothetical protein